MKNKATKYTGGILLSKKEQVSHRQCAWTDEVTFVAPFVGVIPADNPYAIQNAISRKFSRPGAICGSSYGSCHATVDSIDHVAKTVTFTLSYGIGE